MTEPVGDEVSEVAVEQPAAPEAPVSPVKSIRETCARVEGGQLPAFTWPELAEFFRRNYFDNPHEIARREKAARRQRLYDGGGDEQIVEMLEKLFSNRTVQRLREACVAFTKVQNPTKRICQEKGTVYLAPPRRTVSTETDPENQAKLDEVVRQTNLDEVGQVINWLLILHKTLAILPRLRELPTGAVEPTINVTTPDRFYAVRDPLDAGLCVGIIYDLDCQIPIPGTVVPRWRFVGYKETFLISHTKEIMENSIIEFSDGEGMPGLLLTMDMPPGRLLDPDASADIVAAHLDIWFFHILHLKEGKSATKQTIAQGDTSRAMEDQVDDTEAPICVPSGVTVTVVDRSMDFSKFLDDARKLYEACAANHGIPPELLRQGAVASADAREVLRGPLKELRVKQRPTFRTFERDLATILSRMLKDHPAMSFTMDGWAVDFADPQGVRTKTEENQTFETERKLGLTNTPEEIQRRNPDLTFDAARARMLANIAEETARNLALRPLAAASGSMGAPGDGSGNGGGSAPPSAPPPTPPDATQPA